MSKIREPDIIFKWTNCCRLCLSQESTIDLFSEASISQHFPSKIRTCLNFLIYSGDPMPRKICASCCMKLNNWFQFRKDCIQTEKDLKKRLEPYKRISFVKEYFDKYMKYEKSSQDGSISMDSMSEYDEEDIDDEMGDGDEDEEDDEDMEMYSDSMQKEDENSGLSDNDKVLVLSENFENKQNIQKNMSKVHENQLVRNALNNPEITVREKEVSEAGKSSSNFHKANEKTKVQDKHPNEVNKKFCGAKGVNTFPDDTVVVQNSSSNVKSKVRAPVSTSRRNSADQQNALAQESVLKSYPECSEDFPSEELLALHNCNVNESGVESDDNDNFINPLSFVDTSLSEPTKETSEGDCAGPEVPSENLHDQDKYSRKNDSVIPWKCLNCSEHFNSLLELTHYSNQESNCSKADVKLECEVCKCKFESKNDFVDHQVVHADPDKNNSEIDKCSQCDRHFVKEKYECDQNEDGAPVEGEDQYFCSKCEQTFQDKELFEKHELVHNQQDLYNSIVTPQFTTFEGIEDLEEFAEENDKFDDEKRPQNVVRCFRCGKLFGSLEELESHELLKHKNPTPFFCRKCDLRFSARSQLLMHVRSHMRKSGGSESNSSNTCGICNAKFFLPSDLQSHLKMHKYSPSEELPTPPPPVQRAWQSPDPYGDNKIDLFARFKCSVCSKIFVHSGSIIRHGKNLHKGQTVYPLRLKRPIFLMKRARSLSLPNDKNSKNLQIPKQTNSNSITVNSQQQLPQEENSEMDVSQEYKWDQDPDGMKTDLEFGTEKCPFCEKVFKPTYLPRHIKRNHRGEVLDPQMLGRDIPDDSLVCRYCLKSCSNPHNRRVHESIHYPVKLQCTQCKICGQKFYNKSSYEVHILSCKSVRCSKCNKIFFRYLSLKNHSCIVTMSAENKA
ncbi:UNVERIFIED_CONTAM: hypothetical protein PYX00_010849 [Menopon gallinae]|uniref:Uncharacterized protein n=1 Tax=Menopon gallinae TaxID=328185 RepID=A0AAW2H7A2_9NEOP